MCQKFYLWVTNGATVLHQFPLQYSHLIVSNFGLLCMNQIFSWKFLFFPHETHYSVLIYSGIIFRNWRLAEVIRKKRSQRTNAAIVYVGHRSGKKAVNRLPIKSKQGDKSNGHSRWIIALAVVLCIKISWEIVNGRPLQTRVIPQNFVPWSLRLAIIKEFIPQQTYILIASKH